MVEFTQYPEKTTLKFDDCPQRIVSLVPSVTETLIELGVMPVGRSSFCIEPKDIVDSIVRVGGTKTPNHHRIQNLQPDLVITNFEENTKEDVQKLQSEGLSVWVTYPDSVQSMLSLLEELAQLSEKKQQCESIIQMYKDLLEKKFPTSNKTVLTFIWKDPWMVVGTHTYTHDLIEFSGAKNACTEKRYPTLTEHEIVDLSPDIILLPSEPYAFLDEHVAYWKEKIPSADVLKFSGEDLFWSGMRAISACGKLSEIFLREDHSRDEKDCL